MISVLIAPPYHPLTDISLIKNDHVRANLIQLDSELGKLERYNNVKFVNLGNPETSIRVQGFQKQQLKIKRSVLYYPEIPIFRARTTELQKKSYFLGNTTFIPNASTFTGKITAS